MNNELPKGWATCELRHCADVLDSQRVPVNSEERSKKRGQIPYYGATGQVGWIDDYLFDEELVLIGEDGAPFFDKSKPIAYIIQGKSWVSNHAHVLRSNPEITSNHYLKHFLDSFDFHGYVNGTTRLKLTQSVMNEIPIVVAPLPEQHRIVAKLEELLGKVDACQKKLAKIPIILKRFRQSVLAAACSGRLTADWRQDNQSHSESENGELPAGWHWMRVEELLPSGGIFDGPFGSNLKTADYTDEGVRVVRLENVGHLRFINEKESYISQQKYRTLEKHEVGADDIIFASFIDEKVRTCVLPMLRTKAIAKADCFCLRRRVELVDRHYLTFQLVSGESYNRLMENVHGATRPRINTTQLRKLDIRVPSLPEQQEIVRRVESLFTLADQLEARFMRAKASVDKLTQSLLAKAFRGELVPQDPNDEPASELLKRIKEERANQEGATKGKTTRKKKGRAE